jgi:mono/diheme cytochrome c family protein
MRTVILMFLAAALAPAQTVLDRVYTDAQADRGAMQFQSNCAKCHEGADVDGPPLQGGPFIDRWREDTLAALFGFMKTRMPRDSPGKLSDAAYRDVLAFLLKTNDYPSGARELSADAVNSTLLVGKDGPKPLPTNALVRVAGCIAAGANNSVMLSKATSLARSISGDSTTPEELKDSAARPLGSQSFRLQNLDDLKGGFKLETYAGKKVQVKGVLVHQSAGDRINVLSLEAVGSGCAP